jgi:hypothetical protein
MFYNLNIPLNFLNINFKGLIQSIKFPDPVNEPERSKAAWPLQVSLFQGREDASRFEKPEMGKGQVS